MVGIVSNLLEIVADITDKPSHRIEHDPALVGVKLGDQASLAFAIHPHHGLVFSWDFSGDRENRAAFVICVFAAN